MKGLVAQLCPALCDPMDCSPPGSSIHGIFQARILEWVAILFSRGSSQPRDQAQISRFAGRFFTIWATRETPRTLEWVAVPFSRESSQPRDRTQVSCIAGRFFTRWATREASTFQFTYLVLSHCKTKWEFSERDWSRYFEKTTISLLFYQCFNIILYLHLHEKVVSLRQNDILKYTDAANKTSRGCSTET